MSHRVQFFGHFEKEHYSEEYLKNLLMLPKNLFCESRVSISVHFSR